MFLITIITILCIVLFFIWILLYFKAGFHTTMKIISLLILLFMLYTILSDIPLMRQELEYYHKYATHGASSLKSATTVSEDDTTPSHFTENKERNRKEGILYKIDDTEKVTLTSRNGEICVRIPRWKSFSTVWTDLLLGNERYIQGNFCLYCSNQSFIRSYADRRHRGTAATRIHRQKRTVHSRKNGIY